MSFPSGTTFPGSVLFPAGFSPSGPVSDGRSTVYTIGDHFAAVNNGQPYVDADGNWWSVTREEGWSTQPAARAQLIDNPVEDGQRSSNLLIAARPIVLGGTIRASDQLRLQRAIDKMSALLAADVREDFLTVAEPHVRRHLVVRRDQVTQIAKMSPYTAVWLLQLVADTARRLGDTLSTFTGLPSTIGGLTFPFTFPFTFNSTVVSGQCSLTNPGDKRGPVTMRIDGPVVAPIVTHKGTGNPVVFASTLSLGPGEWLDVDLEAHTATANGQASRAGFIDHLATRWSGFDPGPNTWALTAATYNPATRLTVYATPAWP
jgi:hypothetical protein